MNARDYEAVALINLAVRTPSRILYDIHDRHRQDSSLISILDHEGSPLGNSRVRRKEIHESGEVRWRKPSERDARRWADGELYRRHLCLAGCRGDGRQCQEYTQSS